MAYRTLANGTRVGTPEDAAAALNDPSHRLAPVMENGQVVGYSGPGRDTSIHSKISRAMPYVVGGGFAYGQLAPLLAGSAGGAGTAGAASVIPGTGIPVVSGTGPGVTPPPSLGGIRPRSVIDNGVNAVLDRLTGGGSDTGGGILDKLLSKGGISALATLLPLLMSRSSSPTSPELQRTNQQVNDLMAMATQRVQRTDPLHQMVTRLAESRMPTTSRG